MKKKWISFLLVALSVLLLAGCGEENRKSVQSTKSTDSSITTSTDSDKGSTTDRKTATDSTESGTGDKTKIDNTVSGTQTPSLNASGYINGNHETRTWQQMVDNGTVHDRDGDLLDGENSSW